MARSPFLKSVEDYMRVHRYSRLTINSYLYWIKFFILFNGKQYPSALGYRIERVWDGGGQAVHGTGVWLPDALACIYVGMACAVGWHSLVPALAVAGPGGYWRRHT